MYARIQLATIEVPDHKNLLAAWQLHGDSTLVGRFTVAKMLTESQLRRLPAELREMLQ